MLDGSASGSYNEKGDGSRGSVRDGFGVDLGCVVDSQGEKMGGVQKGARDHVKVWIRLVTVR
jgi:hypothetical protein